MNASILPATARSLLEWYAEAGVDETVQDFPRRFLRSAAEAIPQPVTVCGPVACEPAARGLADPAAAPTAVPLSTPPRSAAQMAKEAAQRCTTLAELRAAVEGFEGCSLKKTAMHTVFADGNPEARVMIIGEAPGAEEDRQGVPFCGPSGQLLDNMLSYIGLKRSENFYITNTLFWRPPGNRKPSAEELAICEPFVRKHIALMKPEFLILVGGTATTALLGETRGISRLRGRFYTYTNDEMQKALPVGVLYHPSYLLRQPAHKRLAWQDALSIQAYLQQQGVLP